MHSKAKILLSSVLLMALAHSCNRGNRSGNSSLYGKPGEVLIVMSEEAWEGSPGNACRDLFGIPFEMLPQYEPQFDISHIGFGSYRDFFLLHRNILVTRIDPEMPETSMQVQDDPLIPSQLVITLSAVNDSAFLQLLAANRAKILNLLVNAERKRIIDNNKRNADLTLSDTIRYRFGIHLTMPKGYQIVFETDGFLWLQKETGSIIQAILIYHESPPGPPDELSPSYLIACRDTLLKRYVPGTVPGSYMATEKEFTPVATNYSLADQSIAVEIRGLWRMENGISMGGPFVSLTRYDNQNVEYTTVEGFVFAAGFSKRNYMRELEAILSTWE